VFACACAMCVRSVCVYMITCVYLARLFKCIAVCCSVLQCVAECCSVLQCIAVYCSVLQCVAVSCSELQCVAVRCVVSILHIRVSVHVCLCVCWYARLGQCAYVQLTFSTVYMCVCAYVHMFIFVYVCMSVCL